MISQLTANQLDTIATLWESLNALHQQLDKECNMPVRTTQWGQRREELQAKLKVGGLLEVAYERSQLVGYCFSSVSGEGIGEIDSLFVLPDCRGKGIGHQLMSRALTWLDGKQCTDIKIWVHPGNTAAVRFYWKYGFGGGPEM